MFRRLLREYLSLSRGERRGFRVLLALIILLLSLRTVLPFLPRHGGKIHGPAAEDVEAMLDSLRKGTVPSAVASVTDLFTFDPNTAAFGDLVRLGISPGVAGILINYRNAGGLFRRDSDLLRVYGMEEAVFRRLQPYIRIEGTGRPGTKFKGTQTGAAGDRAFAMVPAGGNAKGDSPGVPSGRSVVDVSPIVSPGISTGMFELNAADSLQLLSVYGIGPTFARRIIRYRELLGGFYGREQLREVYGFSPKQYRELAARSTIDTSLLRKLDLNLLDAEGLSRHPYLDAYQAGALVAFRERMGAFETAEQVVENRLLPDSVFLKIRPYLKAGR